MQKKLYVLVDNSYSLAYQGVQAGHCVAEWIKHNPELAKQWDNQVLVYLQTSDLWSISINLRILDVEYTGFREPDKNNELTAIACYCDGRLFKNFKLMGK